MLIIISEDGGVYIYRPNDIKWNRGVGDKNEWEIQDNQFCLKWDQGSQGWFCRDYSIKKDKVYQSFRIGVKIAGCSGYEYFFYYEESHAQDDTVIKHDDCTLLIDPKSLQFLKGRKVDYE